MMDSGYRVLLIEDSTSDARLLEHWLRSNPHPGFEVQTASNLRDGLACAAARPYDVVLLDLTLPDSCGIETFEQFAKAFPALPVVVLSGVADEEVALNAVQRGAQDYLVKGGDNPRILVRSLAYAIERFRANREVRQQQETLRLVTEQLPALIWTTDCDLKMTSFTGAARHELQCLPGTASGQTLTDFFHLTADPHPLTSLHQQAVAGSPQTSDVRWQDRILHVHCEPFRNREGHLLGTIGVALDITDQVTVDAELRMTRRVQEDLRPKQAPPLTGFDIAGDSRSAAAAGGDYIDYFSLADGSLGLVVCDVGGHGLGPAMMMCQTRAYLRALATTEADLAELLTRVNRFLCHDSHESRIVPLIMAKLRSEDRHLIYAAAGQRGYVINPDGQVRVLECTGIPLNVAEDSHYTVGELCLQPGDVVVMATDGITDGLCPDDGAAGTQHLLDLVRQHQSLPAERIVASIIRSVQDRMLQEVLQDDMTAMVIRVL